MPSAIYASITICTNCAKEKFPTKTASPAYSIFICDLCKKECNTNEDLKAELKEVVATVQKYAAQFSETDNANDLFELFASIRDACYRGSSAQSTLNTRLAMNPPKPEAQTTTPPVEDIVIPEARSEAVATAEAAN